MFDLKKKSNIFFEKLYNYNFYKNFGYVHLSAGDLLRAERNRPESKIGEEIEDHIRKGTIVPVEITCTLLENVLILILLSL